MQLREAWQFQRTKMVYLNFPKIRMNICSSPCSDLSKSSFSPARSMGSTVPCTSACNDAVHFLVNLKAVNMSIRTVDGTSARYSDECNAYCVSVKHEHTGSEIPAKMKAGHALRAMYSLFVWGETVEISR